MPSTRDIKRRIRSVKNTSQITKAMEVVSATKMRRSQEFALKARPYATASLELMQNLMLRMPEGVMPPLLTRREVKRSLLLVITSDKGLAGAFNANVLRKADQRLSRQYMVFARPYIITVGKKAKDYFERLQARIHADEYADPRGRIQIIKSFTGFGDYTTPEETSPIADLILEGFSDGSWDEAEAVYTSFRTTLVQEAALKKILPATREGLQEAVEGILPERGLFAEKTQNPKPKTQNYNYEYKFEPSPAEILQSLVPRLIRMHVHHIILESNASEHSARMVAMKNASDNATELISGLSLAYNKARQAGITRELIEVTAGAEALKL